MSLEGYCRARAWAKGGLVVIASSYLSVGLGLGLRVAWWLLPPYLFNSVKSSSESCMGEGYCRARAWAKGGLVVIASILVQQCQEQLWERALHCLQ